MYSFLQVSISFSAVNSSSNLKFQFFYFLMCVQCWILILMTKILTGIAIAADISIVTQSRIVTTELTKLLF